MDKYETRRQRLKLLIQQRCNGNVAEFARKIERSPSYVGRMLYPAGKEGKRNIAGTLLEVIESKFNLPRGWLDGVEQDPGLSEIGALWGELSPYKRLVIVHIVRAIASAEEPETDDRADPEPPFSPVTASDRRCRQRRVTGRPDRRRHERRQRELVQ